MSKYGYFHDAKKEYVVTNPATPIKWCNYVGTLQFGGVVDTTGGSLICKGDPALKLWVVGHTDWVGKVDDNMRLAQARAEAVASELVSAHGINAARLKGYGVGPLAPVAGNDDEAGRAKNRRVDLVKAP